MNINIAKVVFKVHKYTFIKIFPQFRYIINSWELMMLVCTELVIIFEILLQIIR